MHEVDFLPVGDGGDSGDAIALRFTHPTGGKWVQVVIDAGYGGDGDDLVSHIRDYYENDWIDLLILTHPDADHIGGMGEVVRGIDVKELWLHDIGAHGGGSLEAASAVRDLIGVARNRGTVVKEAWAGAQAFDGAVTILGPDRAYYNELVAEQVSGPGSFAVGGKALLEAARNIGDRIAGFLGIEIPFAEKEVTPRNNSSMITLVREDGQSLLLTADAGVPALERAWDLAKQKGLVTGPPNFVQVPHHGSRRNASSAWLNRLLGPISGPQTGIAFVSVVETSDKHPSGRVLNAYLRRSFPVIPTAGFAKCHRHGTSPRAGWSQAFPLGPMVEEEDS